jgi:hypothetical protein
VAAIDLGKGVKIRPELNIPLWGDWESGYNVYLDQPPSDMPSPRRGEATFDPWPPREAALRLDLKKMCVHRVLPGKVTTDFDVVNWDA